MGGGGGGGRISCPLEAVDLKQICTDYEATFIDAQPDLLLEFFSHNFSHFSRIKVINFKRDIFCLEIKVKNFRGGDIFCLEISHYGCATLPNSKNTNFVRNTLTSKTRGKLIILFLTIAPF